MLLPPLQAEELQEEGATLPEALPPGSPLHHTARPRTIVWHDALGILIIPTPPPGHVRKYISKPKNYFRPRATCYCSAIKVLHLENLQKTTKFRDQKHSARSTPLAFASAQVPRSCLPVSLGWCRMRLEGVDDVSCYHLLPITGQLKVLNLIYRLCRYFIPHPRPS